MVIDIIKKWEKEKLDECTAFWMNKKERAEKNTSLEKIFSNEKRIKNVLLGLNESESMIFNFLIDTDEEKSKNSLHEKFKNKIHEIDDALTGLTSKGLITIMKNRAKLNDRLDKIYVNEIVEKTIKFKNIIIKNTKIKYDLEIKKDLKINAESYYKICSNVLTEYIAAKYTNEKPQNIHDGLIFIDGVFKKANLYRIVNKKLKIKNVNYEKYNLSDYLYINIISILIIYFRSKRISITKTGYLHSKDELKLINSYKINKNDIAFILDWLRNNKWIKICDGIIEVSTMAKKWISLDLDEKVNQIKEEFETEIESSFKNKNSIKLMKVINNLRSKYDMNTTSDYDDLCKVFTKWLQNMKMLLKFGCIEISFKEDSIDTFSINDLCIKDNLQKGSLIISANMEFILYSPVPWQEFYLNAFTIMNVENDVFIGKISQESIIKGIKMGLSGDIFISMIKNSSKDEIPQNVLFSIKEWIADYKSYKIERKYIFRGDIDVIEILLIDPELNEFIEERIKRDTIIFKSFDERKINAILEKHNIYLGYEKNEEN